MAWLEQKSSGNFLVAFRYGEQKFKKSLKTKSRQTAETRLRRLEENLSLVEVGRLVIPTDADIAAFLLSDGQINGRPQPRSTIRTLKNLCDAFKYAIPDGSLEANTLVYLDIHIRHLKRHMGANASIRDLQLDDLQAYVDARAKEPGIRGKKLSPTTIRKEIATLRLIWNWARDANHFERVLPQKGLRYPKLQEKPPFQTREQIERKIARGGLNEAAEADLWDCLFLTLPEIDEVLSHVEKVARHPFIYPMFVFAAHTAARRSEMIRSQWEDIDLAAGTVTIREKKRVRGKLTTRTVPISPLLQS
ncbi:MAG: site-specific integrase [Pirellulales bacterium]